MQSNWQKEQIGMHADVFSGFAFKSADLNEHEGIPVVKIKNVNHGVVDLSDTEFFPGGLIGQKHDKFFLSDGDVLIAMTGQGSVGRVGRLRLDNGKRVLLNQRVGKFVPLQSLDLDYFYYIASTPYYEQIFFNAGIGSGQPNLSPDDIRKIKIPIPPLKVQKAIAHILGSLDRKIENLRRQNETLEAIAQTLFKHWFVDFEFPNEDGKPHKSSGGEMVRSELGEIPVGWRIGKLRDITEVINGRAYKQTEFKEEGTPIVRIQNLTGKGQTVYSDLTLDKDKYINKGDLIYAWSATFGPYIWRGVKSIYHYHIWKLNCFNSAFKYYLYIHLKNVSDRVKSQGTGSIFTHITKELMESQELFIPRDDVMERWHDLSRSAFDKIMLNHEQIESLTKTRDVLLPQLMSGKLRISS